MGGRGHGRSVEQAAENASAPRDSSARAFPGVEESLFLSVLRTADALLAGEVEILRGADLSFAQYNVLRILRGAGGDGLTCGEIADRMVNRDPDVTRLLDRLEARKLVARSRDQRDRRVVMTRVSAAGLDLLKELDGPVQDIHRRQLAHLTKDQRTRLSDLLALAREAPR